MKVVVNEIPRHGLFMEETGTGESLDIERDDIRFSEPIVIKAAVSREYDHVTIELKVSSRIKFACARCLEKGSRPLDKTIELIEPVAQQTEIDLTQIVREEIILDYPVRMLCRDDCKGLCPVCGTNLNKHECGCKGMDAPGRGINLNI